MSFNGQITKMWHAHTMIIINKNEQANDICNHLDESHNHYK